MGFWSKKGEMSLKILLKADPRIRRYAVWNHRVASLSRISMMPSRKAKLNPGKSAVLWGKRALQTPLLQQRFLMLGIDNRKIVLASLWLSSRNLVQSTRPLSIEVIWVKCRLWYDLNEMVEWVHFERRQKIRIWFVGLSPKLKWSKIAQSTLYWVMSNQTNRCQSLRSESQVMSQCVSTDVRLFSRLKLASILFKRRDLLKRSDRRKRLFSGHFRKRTKETLICLA